MKQSMQKLNFQSKARNLLALQSVLKSAKVLPCVITSLSKLKKDQQGELKKIKSLHANTLIIRSSSKSEDSEASSNAGAFLSLANIKASDESALLKALQEVGSSMPHEDDEILIQAMLTQIKLCGVAFSVDKDNLSPYFCIQYDKSGSNASITDGSAKELTSFFHYRNAPLPKHKRLARIITLIKELERLFGSAFLDIEFAFAEFKGEEELFCLQVRPLVSKNKLNLFKALPKEALTRLSKRFESLQNSRLEVYGKKAIFGVMPDWNPAEIIGLKPKRLALSLYKEIVTDNIWAYQRDNYGYKNLRSHPLMHSFLGIAYIDVRLSFNSFIPKDLEASIANKLANYYLAKLEKNPYLHDKIEFDIVFSSYDFDLSQKLAPLLQEGFNENELKRIEFSLLNLTNSIIDPKNGLYLKDIEKCKKLQTSFKELEKSKISLIDKIYWAIEDCKRYGTLPFAGVARAAFVAMQMLNSLVEIGFLSKEERALFLNSLQTISKKLSLASCNLDSSNKEAFLAHFGHLRAGTYNILSPRYDEAFELYFDEKQNKTPLHQEKPFKLSAKRLKELDILLKENGLIVNAKEFFAFLKTAIEGREELKFEFSKLLSLVLKLIEELGRHYEIDKEDLAHLDIKELLNLYSSLYSKSPKKRLLSQISINKAEYELTQALKLPSLITHKEQIFSFFAPSLAPNFITQKSLVAYTALEHEKELEGKIVLIYAADPGYDYLFSKNIAGFITCYGGANSHMAIRASELGLPAVIGVGEENFKKYLSAKKLRLECESELIFCL